MVEEDDDDDEEADGDAEEALTPEQPATAARKPKKHYCNLSPVTVDYLEKLAKAGTHGTSKGQVMRRLIESGVRQAIREGFLVKREP